jgi:hypothetical protein
MCLLMFELYCLVLCQGKADVACSTRMVKKVVLVVSVLAFVSATMALGCLNTRDEQS